MGFDVVRVDLVDNFPPIAIAAHEEQEWWFITGRGWRDDVNRALLFDILPSASIPFDVKIVSQGSQVIFDTSGNEVIRRTVTFRNDGEFERVFYVRVVRVPSAG